jgi:hypothetical protein
MWIYAPMPVPVPPPAALAGPLPHNAVPGAPGQWTVNAAANAAGLVVGHDYDVTLVNAIGPAAGNAPSRVRCTAVAPPHYAFTVL